MYYDVYTEFQSFDDVDELNEHVRRHLYYRADQLNKTQVTVLKLLSRYSCKIPGCSWLKTATVARLVDKSEVTARRALKQLEQLGIIRKVATTRMGKGGSGYNIAIIKPVDMPEMIGREEQPNVSGASVKGSGSTRETVINKLNTYVSESVESLDDTYTPSHIPADFIAAVRPFYRKAHAIYRLWGTVKVAYANSGLDMPLEQAVVTVVSAFKQTVFAKKARRIKGEFGGYFYGTLRGMFAVERRREVAAAGGLFGSWLTA
jgi:predicted metallopeptidase